jgi:tetratricopeptide (TPR) repeat protein
MVVERARTAGHTYLQAQGHFRWGWALGSQYDYATAQTQFEAALSLASTAGLLDVEADALSRLAVICWDQREWTAGREYFERSLRLYQQTSDRVGEIGTLCNFAIFAANQGEYAWAWERLDRCLHAFQEIGDRRGEGIGLGGFGSICLRTGQYGMAGRYLQQALHISREVGSRAFEPYYLCSLADTALHLDDYVQAQAYAEEALSIARELDLIGDLSSTLNVLGGLHRAEGRLNIANDCYEEALDSARQTGSPSLIAPTLAGLSDVALAQDDLSQAGGHVAEVLTVLEEGRPLPTWVRPFRIRLTCYRVLAAAGDPRAGEFLQKTYDSLMEYSDRIGDETMRRSFLENVAENREIVAEWEARHRP